MCSSVIYALPLIFYDLAFRFADTLEWDALRNNLRFQKSFDDPEPKQFTSNAKSAWIHASGNLLHVAPVEAGVHT